MEPYTDLPLELATIPQIMEELHSRSHVGDLVFFWEGELILGKGMHPTLLNAVGRYLIHVSDEQALDKECESDNSDTE